MAAPFVVPIYQRANQSLIFNGRKLQGFGEDNVMTITPRGGDVQITMGADGAYASLNMYGGAEFEISLALGSDSIDYLTKLWQAQIATPKLNQATPSYMVTYIENYGRNHEFAGVYFGAQPTNTFGSERMPQYKILLTCTSYNLITN